MKKFLALLLAAVMVMALAACGGTTEDPDNSNSGTETGLEKLKIGFIFIHDDKSTYDLNFMKAAEAMQEHFGLSDDQVIFKSPVPEGNECYETACDLVDAGCNIIFADSFGHEPFIIKCAHENPDVEFCHATGVKAHTEGLANYHNAFASIYEGRYLTGITAGMKLNQMIEEGKITAEEAVLGYVGAWPYAEVISGYTSFFLGARSVCPSATMKVNFTNSWYDPEGERDNAQALIAQGCKVISQHADSMGAPNACENAGVPNVSYNVSTIDDCPNTFLVASKVDWTPYFIHMVECVRDGKPIEADYCGTIAGGSVVLTDINEQVCAPGTAEKLEEIKAQFVAGTLKVFDTSTFTVGGKTLTSQLADVDDAGDFVPETEAIKDGYYHESEMRSGPYFDLSIDGITRLDG